MAIRLTIRDLRYPQGEFHRGFVQNRVVIGRSRTCDICLPDLFISPMHLEIRLDKTDYVAVDLDSRNGTTISNKKLISHRPKRLKSNDVIQLAPYEIHFSEGVCTDLMNGTDQSNQHARAMLDAIIDDASIDTPPTLTIASGPGKGTRFELEPEPSNSIIGRAHDHQIRLQDTDISRQHAKIIFENGTITVADLKSRNGIIYEGEKCAQFELKQGQTFTVGKTTFVLEHPLDPVLYAIQEAPEEETVDYTPIQPPPNSNEAESTSKGLDKNFIPKGDTQKSDPKKVPAKSDSNKLPIGPKDPLNHENQRRYTNTDESPLSAIPEKNDVGLIIIGAIIVVTCVIGLAWLLT